MTLVPASSDGAGGGGGGFVAYAKRTTGSPITTTGTTYATGVDLLGSAVAFTADGVSDYLVTISAGSLQNSTGGSESQLSLNVDGLDTGRFSFAFTTGASVGQVCVPLNARGVIVAPTAGSHTVNVRLWVSGGTGTVTFGAAGAGNDTPLVLTVEPS